jgi:hypothetical protein
MIQNIKKLIFNKKFNFYETRYKQCRKNKSNTVLKVMCYK